MKTLFCIVLTFFAILPSMMSQSFTGSFDLVIHQYYTNGNVSTDTVSYYFTKEKTALYFHGKTKNSDLKLIFHPSDTTITGLFEINGRKGGYILPMDEEHWPGLPQSTREYVEYSEQDIQYTGEEKIMEGYTCKEVLADNDDYFATLWLAEDIPLSMTRVLSYQSVGKGESKKEIELFDQLGVNGLPLQLFLKSKKGKANVKIHLINLSNNVSSEAFSTKGHQLSEIDN